MPENDTMLLSCFLTNKADPQSGIYHQPDDAAKLMLAESCRKHKTHLMIFHDNLSQDFIKQQSDRYVQFHKVGQEKYCCADNRFFFYRDWITENNCRRLFLSDLFDCKINKHPNHLIPLINHYGLLISNEPDRIGDSNTPGGTWMISKLQQCYGQLPEELLDKQVLNVGLFGGAYDVVLRFVDLMCSEIESLAKNNHDIHADMAAMNMVAYACTQDFWAKGWPFHSVFKAYEKNSTAVFSHK